jgi:hypothetical protein
LSIVFGEADPPFSGRRADLKQTKFLFIAVQAVGLGIDRHPIGRLKLWKQLAKLRNVRDHAWRSRFFVIPSGVEESLNISETSRDVSTSVDMTE